MRARRGKATGLTALDRQPRRRVERTSRLPNQPVSQRDKLGSPVPSVRVVSMLDLWLSFSDDGDDDKALLDLLAAPAEPSL
ncbi:hypothetical protein GB937_000655 [Aspergillus fischeri]|nr:hypothetical protein GB937_000655 [Aspergillus fischeri]